MSIRLHELDAAEHALADDLLDADELSPEMEQRIAAFEGDREHELAWRWKLAEELDAEAEAIDAQIKRLRARKDAKANHAQRLRGAILDYLTRNGIERHDLDGIGTLKVRQCPPSVDYSGPPEDLPDRFYRVKVESDKAALLAAWKAGEVLPEGVRVVKRLKVEVR